VKTSLFLDLVFLFFFAGLIFFPPFEVFGARSLKIVVMDEAFLTPIEGAFVIINSPLAPETLVTNNFGVVQFEDVENFPGAYAEASDFFPGSGTPFLTVPPSTLVTDTILLIKKNRRIKIHGLVSEGTGTSGASLPISGVTVYLQLNCYSEALPGIGVNSRGLGISPPCDCFGICRIIDSAVTGTDGTYEFEAWSPNVDYEVWVYTEDFYPVREQKLFGTDSGENKINFDLWKKGIVSNASGYVRDRETNLPLIGVSIGIRNAETFLYLSGFTDTNGFYQIDSIGPPGNATMTITHSGYIRENKAVVLEPNGTLTQDFFLYREYTNSVIDTVGNLVISMATDKKDYNLNLESFVKIKYAIENIGSENVTLSVDWHRTCDLQQVFRNQNGTIIYDALEGKVCDDDTGIIVITPGQQYDWSVLLAPLDKLAEGVGGQVELTTQVKGYDNTRASLSFGIVKPSALTFNQGSGGNIQFKVCPNPFSQWARFSLKWPGRKNQGWAAGIFSVTGRKVVSWKGNTPSQWVWRGIDWQGRDVSPGQYLVRFKSAQGEITRKVLKY